MVLPGHHRCRLRIRTICIRPFFTKKVHKSSNYIFTQPRVTWGVASANSLGWSSRMYSPHHLLRRGYYPSCQNRLREKPHPPSSFCHTQSHYHYSDSAAQSVRARTNRGRCPVSFRKPHSYRPKHQEGKYLDFLLLNIPIYYVEMCWGDGSRPPSFLLVACLLYLCVRWERSWSYIHEGQPGVARAPVTGRAMWHLSSQHSPSSQTRFCHSLCALSPCSILCCFRASFVCKSQAC
jgi:hypothetical protein